MATISAYAALSQHGCSRRHWGASLGGVIAYVALYSVVNLTYLFIWKGGELIRALACAATENDGAPWINIGARQPCEQRAIDMSARR